MADSIILATTRAHNATPWTQDEHFQDIEGVKYIEKKPEKSKVHLLIEDMSSHLCFQDRLIQVLISCAYRYKIRHCACFDEHIISHGFNGTRHG